MGQIANFFDRWSTRGLNAVAAWTLLPAGAGGVMTAWLSTSVTWIAALGAFGWFTAGLLGFFVTAIGMAAISKTRLWRIEAKNAERLAGDSSIFDPMASVYHNKRLYLRDLAPLGRRAVNGKKFINCEIIGPGTVILQVRSVETKPWPTMKDSGTWDCDVVQVADASVSSLAVAFFDCDFDGCSFYHLTMLFHYRTEESLNWITAPSPQPLLADMSGTDDDKR